MKEGILVACDAQMEWLLPWWWERYARANTHPVAFVDLGMSEEKRAWCEKRGMVLIMIEQPSLAKVPKKLGREWAASYGKSYEHARAAWFKKPGACLLSPFETTVWVDLDCEVLSSIGSIFSVLTEGKEIAALAEAQMPGLYNSGVLIFKKESVVMQEWAIACLKEGDKHWGDDRVLSLVIRAFSEKVVNLPPIYNWKMSEGIPFYAKIIHWCGEWGKTYIEKKGGLRPHLEQSPLLLSLFEG